MCKFLEFSEIIYYPPGALTFSVIWLQVVATINVTKWPYLRPEVPNPKKTLSFIQLLKLKKRKKLSKMAISQTRGPKSKK